MSTTPTQPTRGEERSPKSRHKAYLLALIALDGTPYPKVCGVGIFSERNPTRALARQLYAEVLTVEGESFQACVDQIVHTVFSVDAYRWLRVWLDNSREAHMARGYMSGQTYPTRASE